MKLLICVQMRLESTRFYEKILQDILGKPMCLFQLERISRANIPNQLVVVSANTDRNKEKLAPILRKNGFICEIPECEPSDVLARYAITAKKYAANAIIRICGDCPLIDPHVIEDLWDLWKKTPLLDHLGLDGGWPDGQDVEIFSRAALLDAWVNATAPSDREHVTPFMWRQPDLFQCATMRCPRDCSWQQYSVDTPQDLALVEALLPLAMAEGGTCFGWEHIDDVLQSNPLLKAMHATRAARNHRYTTQIAAERGTGVPSWDEVRYGR